MNREKPDISLEKLQKKLEKAERKVRLLEDLIEDRTRELHTKKEENESLELFAYITSHDLQEPLRTIMSFVDIFEEDYAHQLDEQGLKYLNYIKGSADRMSQLIKGLLSYSKVGKSRSRKILDSNIMVEEIKMSLKKLIAETRAQIKYEQLPFVNVYEAEWKQLLQNLIHNGIKFRRPGIAPVIEIRAKLKEDHYEFAVKDNGIGIDPKYFDKIFVIFQRLHTQEKYRGSGIGLANARKIVTLHHGRIWVESLPGQGSTFFFTIMN